MKVHKSSNFRWYIVQGRLRIVNKVSRCERAFLRYKDPECAQDNHHHEKSTQKKGSESMKLGWLDGIRTKVVDFQCLISKPSRQ